MDPETAYDTSFVPQGVSADLIATIEGFSRDDVDTFAAESQDRAGQGDRQRRVRPLGRPGASTSTARSCSTTTSSRAPAPPSSRSAGLKPSFAAIGEMGGFDAVALQKYHWVEKINHVHTPGQLLRASSTAPALMVIGSEQAGTDIGLTPAGAHRRHRRRRHRADDHAHRPGPVGQQGAGQGRPERRRHRPVRGQRGLRRRRHEVHDGPRTCRTRRSTSTAARSPSATRSARPAR